MKYLISALLLMMNNSILAQEKAAATPANMMGQYFPFIAIPLILYFFLFRPQKKQLTEEKNMNDSLKKGDEIFTKSGIIGKIVGMTEKVITLEISDGVKLKMLRAQIGGLTAKIFNEEKKV